MAFDVDGALKAGYSQSDIADHLAGQADFNAAGARKAGYSDSEIIQQLSQPAPRSGDTSESSALSDLPEPMQAPTVAEPTPAAPARANGPARPVDTSASSALSDLPEPMQAPGGADDPAPQDMANRMLRNAGRSVAGGVRKMAEGAGMALAAPAVVYDKAHSLLSGDEHTEAQDFVFKHAVDPNVEAQERLAIKPEEAPTLVEKVVNGLFRMVPDLGVIAATGGGAAVPEASLAMQGGIEGIKALVAHSMRSMSVVSFNSGVTRASELIRQGVPVDKAVQAGLVEGAVSDVTGGLPMAAPGATLASRIVQGGALQTAGGEMGREMQNAVLPSSMHQGFDLSNAATSFATGGLMAGTMAHPAQPLGEFTGRPNAPTPAGELSPRAEVPAVAPVTDGPAALRDTPPVAPGSTTAQLAAILGIDPNAPRANATLAGRPIESYTGERLQELADSPVVTADVKAKVNTEIARRATDAAPDAAAAAPSAETPAATPEAEQTPAVAAPSEAPTDTTAQTRKAAIDDITQEQKARQDGGVTDAGRAVAGGDEPTAPLPNLESQRSQNADELAAGNRRLADSSDQKTQLGVIADDRVFAASQHVADAIHAVSGVRPVMYHDPRPNAPDGFAMDGQSYVNAANLQQSLHSTVFHETFHVAEQRAAAGDVSAQQFINSAYKIFDMIPAAAKEQYAREYLFRNEMKGDSPKMSVEDALNHPALKSEMIADFFGKRGQDVGFLNSLARKDKPGFGGFARTWIDSLSNMIAEFKAKRDGGVKDVDQFITNLSKAKATAASALIEWRRSNPLLADSVPKAGATRTAAAKKLKLAPEAVLSPDVLKKAQDFSAADHPPTADQLTAEGRAKAGAILAPKLEAATQAKPDFDRRLTNIAEQMGGDTKLADVKGEERAATRLGNEQGGSADNVRDLLRGSVVVPTIHDVPDALRAISRNFTIEPGRIKDRFTDSPETAYQDVAVNVVTPNGTKGEIQIHLPETMAVKDLAHAIYNVEREMPPGAAKDGLVELQRQINSEAAKAGAPLAAEPMKVFSTRKAAEAARDEHGNTHKLRQVDGGFILRAKSDAEVRAGQAAGQRLRRKAAPDVDKDSLLPAIAKLGGLSMNERADTIHEGNRNVGGKMLFTKDGRAIDLMAHALSEDGYIPHEAMKSDGGVSWLQSAIGDEFGGHQTHYSQNGEAWMRARQRDAMGEHEPLERFSAADLNEAGYAHTDTETQALVERMAAEYDALGLHDDAPAADGKPDADHHAEINRDVQEAVAQARADAARRDAEATRRRDADHGEVAGDQSEEGLTLEAQTEQGLREKAAREKAGADAARAKRAAEQEALSKAADARENKARADASVGDFKLGQSADEQMSGQAPMFSRKLEDGSAHAGYEKSETPRVLAASRLTNLIRDRDAGKLSPEKFDGKLKDLAGELSQVRDTKASNRLYTERERGPDMVRERVMRAMRQGDIDRPTGEFALWALGKNPALAEGLGISVRTAKEGGGAGRYNPASSVMALFKERTNTGTAVHDILHHTERMMPAEIQAPIRREWAQQVARAVGRAEKANDVPRMEALRDMIAASEGSAPAQRLLVEHFKEGRLEYDRDYPLTNPSEFWAVNATRILSRRFEADSWVGKAKAWMGEMVEKAKGLLRLRSDAPVLRGMAEVMSSDGVRASKDMLMTGKNDFSDPKNPDIRRSDKWEDEEDHASLNAPAAPIPTAAQRPLSGAPAAPKSALAQKGAAFMDKAKELGNDLLMKVSPMSVGTDPARAIAKDYANAERGARYQWAKFDQKLSKDFNEKQRTDMYNAADEQNDILSRGLTPGPEEGLNRLNDDQRSVLDMLHNYGETLLQRARDVDMFEGQSLPYWAPRISVMIGEDGEISRPRIDVDADAPTPGGSNSTGDGANISLSAPSLKSRHFQTSREYEAAMKLKNGDGATLIRDIRTMPMALARIESAIAARELINNIKELGQRTGRELVSPGAKPDFFTLDHPAFKTFSPRLEKKDDGTYAVKQDDKGQPIMDSVPIFIAKDFEGPLRAIMSQKSGAIYSGLMSLKGKAMGVIMYSPLIHNAVEWGRALPVMPGKVLTFQVYFAGNRIKNDPVQMRRAISEGLVPIGGHGGNPDITSLMAPHGAEVGRSLTAKALAFPVGLVSKPGALAVKKGVDAAGNFWHNTLLWDRIGDLQAGLYGGLRADLIAKGVKWMDETTAGRLAAHWANRFAGTLPNEAMSSMARKIANITLFSRMFTLGNLGAIKDGLTGLPKDLKSQILRDSGELALRAATSVARRKALGALVTDIALMYAANSLFQDTLDKMSGRKSWGQIGQGYLDRITALAHRVKETPGAVANSPLASLESIFSTSENEPGREGRVYVGPEENSRTAIYARVPFGKVGEDMKGWATSPLATAKAKLSPFVKPLVQTFNNDDGIGHRIYDPEAKGMAGAADTAGRIAWNFMKQQIPVDAVQGAVDWARGDASEADKFKAIGPLAGVTFSKGAPGGPAVGEIYAEQRRQHGELMDQMPKINRALKLGANDPAQWDKALDMMRDLKMSPSQMKTIIEHQTNPESRLSPSAVQKFGKTASDEAKDKLANAMSR